MTNKRISTLIFSGLFLLAMVVMSTVSASAQGRYVNTYSKNTVKGFIDKLERSSNTFRRDFDRAMDRSNLNGTATEDEYNRLVGDYENALDRLQNRFNRNDTWWESRAEVQEMIGRAQPVNGMMVNLPFGRNLESQWRNMRNDINKVADTFDLPGLNGGGWSGGGWNDGWNGGTSRPPSWAQGTFYSTNIPGFTMTISVTGQVTISGPNGTSYGRWNQSTIYINNESFPATRSGDGMRAYNPSTRTYTNYSRTNTGGGGGWGGGDGNSSTPPSWAQGTFYSSNIPGYTMTINRNGTVTISGPNGTSSGNWRGNSIFINNEEFPATRINGGISAMNRSTGTATIYLRR